MKKVLVTCFDPFGGADVNPSQLAVGALSDSVENTAVIKATIPTVFRRSIDALLEAIEKENPCAVILVGQAGGRPSITVERVAINVDDARIKDNEGNQPIDVPVYPEGPAAYFSTLPIKAMVKECNEIGIPASISNTAGTFVCNHLMYGALHHIATRKLDIKSGFVHIPFAPIQTTDQPTMPSMSIECITKGLESFVRTIISAKEDIKVTGGAEH